MNLPRISFGIIVLNGEPFVRYNLRSLYPFAHQIIVVEGAVSAAAVIATPDGHSTDGTLEVLRDFKMYEDPENKIVIVTAENEGHPDGFWRGEKAQQSLAYACRATGDYLWQVDIDEFYTSENMQTVANLVSEDSSISGVSLKTVTFWGSPQYVTNGYILEMGAGVYRRLFKWGKGYKYVSHRPPTVVDENEMDTFGKKWIDGLQLARKGVHLYHYSLLFPRQVEDKCLYYDQAQLDERNAVLWYHESYEGLRSPFRFHNLHMHASWLERFRGKHPEQIQRMWDDIQDGAISVGVRGNSDVERLLANRRYRIGRAWLRLQVQVALARRNVIHSVRTLRGPHIAEGPH